MGRTTTINSDKLERDAMVIDSYHRRIETLKQRKIQDLKYLIMRESELVSELNEIQAIKKDLEKYSLSDD